LSCYRGCSLLQLQLLLLDASERRAGCRRCFHCPSCLYERGLRSKTSFSPPAVAVVFKTKLKAVYEYQYLTSSARFEANISRRRSASGNPIPLKTTTESIRPRSEASRPARSKWLNSEESFYCDPIGPSLDINGPSTRTASSAIAESFFK
jgi:hypothetical protein